MDDDDMDGSYFRSSGRRGGSGMPGGMGGMPGGMGGMPGMGGMGGMGGMPGSMGGMPGGMPGAGTRRAGRGARPQSPEKPAEITRPLKVSLEDLYKGTTKRIKVGRRLLDGTTEDKVLEITVHPGWKSGTKIRFPQAGNEQPSGQSQDLVFVVEEKPHPVFKREGNDLIAHVKIPLIDALTGSPSGAKITRQLEYLDGTKIQVAAPLGIIKPDQTTLVPGEGMPVRKDGEVKSKGDMLIKWQVEFPTTLTPAQKEGLRRILA